MILYTKTPRVLQLASSFVDSIVDKKVPQPLSPVANESIKESVANVANIGAANKIVVTAEIHNEPGVVKSVNKENELVSTEKQKVLRPVRKLMASQSSWRMGL